MSLIFAETFDFSGLYIHTPQMTLSEVHRKMDDGQKLGQILFDLEMEDYNIGEFK